MRESKTRRESRRAESLYLLQEHGQGDLSVSLTWLTGSRATRCNHDDISAAVQSNNRVRHPTWVRSGGRARRALGASQGLEPA